MESQSYLLWKRSLIEVEDCFTSGNASQSYLLWKRSLIFFFVVAHKAQKGRSPIFSGSGL